MVRSAVLVAWCAAAGIEACFAEAVRQQDVDADALSLLQKKAVVSRRAQEEAHSQTDIENEWGLGDMLSSVVEAVHGAFQNDPDPADKHALQLMEANKTVVTANTTARGVLHLVHGCHQCGFHFCDKASIKESKAGIEDSYLVGTAVSEWGCDKVVDPYVVHDKRTRKVYAVEFLETKPQEARVSKEEVSKAKASKTEVKHSAKSKVNDESDSESHTSTEAKAAGKKVIDSKSKKSVSAGGADSSSKHKWPDFSLPHLEATDKIKEKISSMATVHAHSNNADKQSKATSNEKTKIEKSSEASVDEVKNESAVQAKHSNSAGSKTEKKEKTSTVKSGKSEEPALAAKQHEHDSSFMEHGVVVTDKEDFPNLKIPHVIQKAVETTEEKISSKFSEDKNVESKEKSTTHTKGTKLASNSKEGTEEKTHGHASAESVKSDKHGEKASQHPHDSLLMEHGIAVAEKQDFPNLNFPHMFHKADEKLSGKKSDIKGESTAHVKESKLSAGTKEEKQDDHSSAKKVKSDKSDAGEKENHSHSTSAGKGHATK